jgi:osmotically inducible protein OsmC
MAYVTSATTKGGRNGRAMLDNGALALAMAAPKEIGGAGDGHNPEQLFAMCALIRRQPREIFRSS